MHGYEYWFVLDTPPTLSEEKWWSNGEQHGVERAYLRAAKRDPSLRPFSVDDNRPERDFPPEVAVHLR